TRLDFRRILFQSNVKNKTNEAVPTLPIYRTRYPMVLICPGDFSGQWSSRSPGTLLFPGGGHDPRQSGSNHRKRFHDHPGWKDLSHRTRSGTTGRIHFEKIKWSTFISLVYRSQHDLWNTGSPGAGVKTQSTGFYFRQTRGLFLE